MIIFDTNERQHLEPALSMNSAFLPDLETKTGADFVLSTWDAPPIDSLLWTHVEKGQGIQLKRGTDLPASVFDGRMINQIQKMVQYWTAPILLHHCDVGKKNNDVTFNGRVYRRTFPYTAYDSTLRTWQRCGGVVRTIPDSYSIKDWIGDELNRMSKDKDERIIRKPQVKLTNLTPQEETLATFPGVGPTRAHELWNALPTHGARQTLLQAICWLTDGYVEMAVKGFGPGIIGKAKRHLGVSDSDRLWVEPREGMKVSEDEFVKVEVLDKGV